MLPPSESKTAPDAGPSLRWQDLSSPSLNVHREKLLAELALVSQAADALEVLKVGASLEAEVLANLELLTAACAPAAEVYSGVLYAAADLGGLNPAQQERAHRSVRTISALWGAVSPADLIPAYRLSMGIKLPQTGALATSWRQHLDPVLAPMAQDSVIIDCRSAAYLNAWKPAKTLNTQWITVRVLRELAGKRTVVSHNAKHARGVLTAHLLRAKTEAHSTEQVLEVAQKCPEFLEVNLQETGAHSAVLELVVS